MDWNILNVEEGFGKFNRNRDLKISEFSRKSIANTDVPETLYAFLTVFESKISVSVGSLSGTGIEYWKQDISLAELGIKSLGYIGTFGYARPSAVFQALLADTALGLHVSWLGVSLVARAARAT